MGLETIVKKEYVENDKTLCFKTMSLWKFFVLSVLSLGIYNIIWAYDCWKMLKNNFGYKVSPFWRGFFSIFTNFKLFPIFEKYFSCSNEKFSNPMLWAFIYLSLYIKDLKYDLLSLKTDEIIITQEIISYCIIIAMALILTFIQKKINKVNKMYYPDAPKNSWTVANTIWTIVLSALFVLYLYMIFTEPHKLI